MLENRVVMRKFVNVKKRLPQHLLLGSLSNDDGDGNENGKKAISLD